MSLQSMTGHGHGHAVRQGLRVAIELSAVNRKQLDVAISLPRALAGLESRVQELVRQALTRGRISGELTLQPAGRDRTQAVRVDAALAAAYVRSLRALARRLKLRDDLGASLLLELPDVVQGVSAAETDPARVWPAVEKALQQALRGVQRMRRREGRALQRDLETRLARLRRQVARIRRRAPQAVARYRDQLLARLQEAGLAVAPTDERLLKELALFADRSDIAEELTRLQSHFQQAAELMRTQPAPGRSLDFLVQEMLREINTIGSKANDSAIAREVVLFKAELERMREQVQNIE